MIIQVEEAPAQEGEAPVQTEEAPAQQDTPKEGSHKVTVNIL